jgi:hypothetical protein
MPRRDARKGAQVACRGPCPLARIFTPKINYSLRRTELVGVARNRYEQHDRFT